MARCRFCSSVLPEDARKCPNCGAAVAVAAEAVEKESDHWQQASITIRCEACGQGGLRVVNGQTLARCPICGHAPSRESVIRNLFQATHREPAVIEWNDPRAESLLHVDQRGDQIPPLSLLIVKEGQRAVFEAGGRREIKSPGTYALFRDTRSEGEYISAFNAGEVRDYAAARLGTRIMFFDDRKHPIMCDGLAFKFPASMWKVEVALSSAVRFDSAHLENILQNAMDWSNDASATEGIKGLIRDRMQEYYEDEIRRYRRSEELKRIDTEEDMCDWVHENLVSEAALERVRLRVNEDLRAEYGITLDERIRVSPRDVRAQRMERMSECKCPNCGEVSLVPQRILEKKERFSCERCGAKLTYCPHCKQYSTTERLPRICDRCGRNVTHASF